jgi:hypothetical protein
VLSGTPQTRRGDASLRMPKPIRCVREQRELRCSCRALSRDSPSVLRNSRMNRVDMPTCAKLIPVLLAESHHRFRFLKNQTSKASTGIETNSAAIACLRVPALTRSRPQKNSVTTKSGGSRTQQTAIIQAEYEVWRTRKPERATHKLNVANINESDTLELSFTSQ